MRHRVVTWAAALGLATACGSSRNDGGAVVPPPPAALGACAGTSCANPHPAGWSGIALNGTTSVHGDVVRAGDGSCGDCHTQTGDGAGGQLTGSRAGDVHDGLVCTHCHLSAGPGQLALVAGRIHVDGWAAGWTPARRAFEIAADTLAPLRGGVSADCLACHLNG